ncbi:MAG: hypothetical protein M1118_12260 [Chloroflexi bacterium]|nr:hypothetical protein [Chloroflexota bacterium]
MTPSPFPDVLQMNLPGTGRTLLIIARRAAVESLTDRRTLVSGGLFSLAFPLFLVFSAIRPLAHAPGGHAPLVAFLTLYLLLVGLTPTMAATGVASGQFAGEKEQGALTPLLASPASNVAIFGGKVLAAVIPPLVFALIAELAYALSVIITSGTATLRLLPPALSLTILTLIPGISIFAAVLASLVSSRVSGFNASQQITGLLLLPLWGALLMIVAKMSSWGTWTLLLAVIVLYALDIVLTIVAAITWQREEVLAHT